MRAASALDAVDAQCAKGQGPAARTAARAAAPLVQKAREAITSLDARVSSYTQAIAVLDREDVAVTGPAAEVLAGVERGGRAEAAAVKRYRQSVVRVWPAYDQLSTMTDTWITRALTPWYRDQQEGADAYAVLVSPARATLQKARTELAAASTAVEGPTQTQSTTLAAADRVLAQVGSTPGP